MRITCKENSFRVGGEDGTYFAATPTLLTIRCGGGGGGGPEWN